ncbi:hypothetical protein SEPCBS57363_001797 [Sporothrix epigloea]|uniref:Potassium channel domain-containing protein n=1 Tax=Sporothrix epigloea TaxID=1892477 RepID=A0ABP0DFI4_9PEZI
MDDSAGDSLGKYEPELDNAGRPQRPSRQSTMSGDAITAVAASADTQAKERGMKNKEGLMGLDAIVSGRSANLNECLDRFGHQRSNSIDRRAMDAAAIAYDKHATALALGFSKDQPDLTLSPSRWWFASSAFPMIAATLGPVASAFSICALVRPWRQEILEGEAINTASFVKDPIWLTCINAIQLFIALASNMFLLLNMARRVRFAVAQPITMVGWYFSSLALIALTATASGPLQEGISPEKNLVWSQAFYYAIYSAILYMVVASLMVVTFYGAWSGHYPKDFQLTNSQRTLMLQTIMFLMYLLLGALVFSHIEGWTYLDAVYWADITLFTIGFGDFSAETTLGRSLLFPYALIGVISLGLVIGSIRSLALERGQRRIDARMTEKNRRKFLETLKKKGKDSILQPIRANNSSQKGEAQCDDDCLSNGMSTRPTTNGLTEYERREEEFNIMRKIQRDAARKRRWMAMATSTGTWLALWLIGAYIFQVCEHPYQGWNYFDGFYLAFVSLTTIGYGDMVLISNAGRSFFVFWSLLALPATTILISNAGDTIVKSISDATNAVGRITILPGDRGLKRDLKEIVRALTCGAIFEDVDIEEYPPGLLGAAQPLPDEQEEAYVEEEEREQDEAEDAVNDVEKIIHEQGQSGGEDTREESVQNFTPDRDDRDGGSVYRDVADNANDDCNSKRQITPTTSTTLSTGKNMPPLTDHAQSSNNFGVMDSRRSRTGAQMHSSRRNQPKQQQSGGFNFGTSSGSSPVASGGGYVSGSLMSVSVPRLNLPQELPASRAEYHCVLIDEIAQVTQHLRHSPPRKYSFQEWAWFLKLIGEDERNADLHRRAHTKPRKKLWHHNRNSDHHTSEHGKKSPDMNPDDEDPSRLQWSWVGARSPLMGSQEEAEWILDKLTKRLQAELRTTRESITMYQQRRFARQSTNASDVDDNDGKGSRAEQSQAAKEDEQNEAFEDEQRQSDRARSAQFQRQESPHAIEEEEA